MHVQNARDFPETKLDSEINCPVLLKVFAKNSLIKNIFEEEKKFDSGTRPPGFSWKRFRHVTWCILAKART